MSRLLRLLAIVAAIAAASVTAAGSAVAGHTLWCLNGKTTTLPASVAGGGGELTISEFGGDIITRFTLGNDGVFQIGRLTPGGRLFIFFPDFRGQPSPFLPGYSTNVLLRGACVTVAAEVTHVGACKAGGAVRVGDGSTGVFQEITVADWNDPKGRFFDATAANWIEGVGLTCDNPLALGYRAAGYSVSWGGKQDPGHQANGVRGAGFNNIYPYYTK